MLENQLSRYGSASKAIPYLGPGGRMFLVSDSDDTTVGPLNIGNEFPVDKEGVVRVYTTVQAAVNAATANRGDVILVLPGYDQSITAADSWDKAGIRIIGLGSGRSRPTFRYTGAAGEIGLSANDIYVENLRFLAAADSIARAVDFDTGFSSHHMNNCIFDFDTGTNDFRVMLRLGSRRSTVENTRFQASDTLGSGSGIRLKGGDADYAVIRNNYFFGQFDTVVDTSDGGAAIGQDTSDTADTDLSGVVIQENMIVSTDTAVGAAIRFSAGYTARGIVANNRIVSYDCAGVDTVLLALPISATGGMLATDNKISRQDTTEQLVGQAAVAAA